MESNGFAGKLNTGVPDRRSSELGLVRDARVFPHVKSAERQQPAEDKSMREWAQLLRRAGLYAWAKGDYGEAERMSNQLGWRAEG
jgi:hypothetical protein